MKKIQSAASAAVRVLVAVPRAVAWSLLLSLLLSVVQLVGLAVVVQGVAEVPHPWAAPVAKIMSGLVILFVGVWWAWRLQQSEEEAEGEPES